MQVKGEIIRVRNAKRIILVLLAIVLTAFCMVALVGAISFVKKNPAQKDIEAAVFGGGNGSKTSPYLISNADNLMEFASSVVNGCSFNGQYFKMTQDIYMYGKDFLPIGYQVYDETNNYNHLYPFKGKFDGNGCTIYDLTITPPNRNSTMWYLDDYNYNVYSGIGLFGMLAGGAEIKNLMLDGVNISVFNQNATDYPMFYGGIAGAFYANTNTSASISNCAVINMSVTGSKLGYTSYIGSIVGASATAYGSLTVSDCYAENLTVDSKVTSSVSLLGGADSYTNCVYAKKNQSVSWSMTNKAIEKNCTSTANNNSGLDCSSIGTTDVNDDYKTTWYYVKEFNGGYPYLRQFIKYWQEIDFDRDSDFDGTIENTRLSIPRDIKDQVLPSIDEQVNSAIIKVCNQTFTAKPNTGATFKKWKYKGYDNGTAILLYVASSTGDTFKLTFENATGVASGDTISPTGGTSFDVPHSATVTASHQSGNGPITLKYTFKDSSGTACEVTYSITEKYSLTSAGIDGAITADTTISPTVEVRTFSVTFKAATGTNQTTNTTWKVNYGSAITYNSSTIQFTHGSNTLTYTPQTGYRFASLTIKKDDKASNTDALKSVTGNLEIQPTFELWRTVTFKKINNTSVPTSNQTMSVKNGQSITVTLSSDKKTLKYTYNGSSVTYRASQYYILADQSGRTSITVTANMEIAPTATFYACEVTMRNDSRDTKVNQAMATMTVTGDGYGTANDREFVVEFGTTLSATHTTNSSGKEVYTYTFTYNNSTVKTVTYTTTAAKYEINSYGINGKETSHTFSAGTTSKTISPTFQVKQYTLTIMEKKGGTDTQTKKTIYHSDTLTYSANLSLSDDSKFTYATASLYGEPSSKDIQYTGYFIESYTITYGTTTSTVSADGTTISSKNVTVTSKITIEIEFIKFHTVTFTTGQTGVDSATAQNSYTNPMNLKSGSRIQATYTGYPSRNLTYSATYTDGTSITKQVFKYTLSQYYRVTDTKDIDNLQATTTISPSIEFYACEVTIGKEDVSNIATLHVDGAKETSGYTFIVEYGTEVEFATPTQSAGKFTYTYIFKYDGEEIATITYTITNDDYAMSSELTANGRVWHTGLGKSNKLTEYEFTEDAGTGCGISPTFELKEYGGNVA